jgi:hypothetical protein
MKTVAVLLATALALAACVHRETVLPPPPVPGAPAPLTSAPVQSAFEMTPPPMPEHALDPNDMCESARLQYLVGRPRTEIPVPVNPALRRVSCTTCPVTMDFNPRRLNILYEEASGIIKEVKCG